VSERIGRYPVDAIVDFSGPGSIFTYGGDVRCRHPMFVSAVSAWEDSLLSFARRHGGTPRSDLRVPLPDREVTHESIAREAFRTGAAFAIGKPAGSETGFHTFDDLLMRRFRCQLTNA
jgi:hypothetical protein